MSKPQKYIIAVLWILLTLGVALPYLFNNQIMGSYDFTFHLGRVTALTKNIQAGHFPNPILTAYLGKMGYGIGFFYSNFFIYPLALLVAWGLPSFYVLQFTYAVLISLAIISMAICAQLIFHRYWLSLFAASIYATSFYFMTAAYSRSDMGELLALLIIPWLLLGVHAVLLGDTKYWWLLSISFVALLLSHIISFTICIIFAGLMVLFNLKSVILVKKRWQAILKAAIYALGLSAIFLLPMIQQLMAQKLQDTSYDSLTHQAMILTSNLNIINIFDPYGPNTQGYPGVALIYLPALFLLTNLLMTHRFWVKNKFLNQIMLIIFLGSLLLLSKPILTAVYSVLPGIKVLQVIWRINVLFTPLLTLISAYFLNDLLKAISNPILKAVDILALLAVILLCIQIPLQAGYGFTSPRVKLTTIKKIERTVSVSEGEYLPANFSKHYPIINPDPYQITAKQKGVTLETITPFQTILAIKKASRARQILIPKTYYLGYHYQLQAGGKTRQHGNMALAPTGIGKVKVPKHFQGKIKITYQPTTIAIAGQWLTLLTLGLTLLYLIFKGLLLLRN